MNLKKCKFKAKCKARDDKTNALGAENRLKANEFEEFEQNEDGFHGLAIQFELVEVTFPLSTFYTLVQF